MNLCGNCSLNELSGLQLATAVEYADRYDEAMMDGDQTLAASLGPMASNELPRGIARIAQTCLRRRQLGNCIMNDVELVL